MHIKGYRSLSKAFFGGKMEVRAFIELIQIFVALLNMRMEILITNM
jgi:hypothetical protein